MSIAVHELFRKSDVPDVKKWEHLWNGNVTPWDRGVPSPALVELLVEKHFPLLPEGRAGKALVPGCGGGYDVAMLAGLSAQDQKFEKVVGLDVSPKALEKAKARQANGPPSMEFVVGDFFSATEEWATSGPYDVVYDYTVRYIILLTVVSLCLEARDETLVGETHGRTSNSAGIINCASTST
jgi:SAM-dependent methyltransferase